MKLLQKNWKTILYLLDEAQFVDADTPPKLDLRMEELLEIFSSNDIPLDEFGTGIDGEKKTKSNLFQTVDKVVLGLLSWHHFSLFAAIVRPK